MITVALIDDHLIVRPALRSCWGWNLGFAGEALSLVRGARRWRGCRGAVCRCVFHDISMPDISGLELLSQLPKRYGDNNALVRDSPALEQAFNAGHAAFSPNAVALTN